MFKMVKESHVFKGVSEEFINKVFLKATEVSCKKGDYLFKQGDPGEGMYIVLSGELEALVDGEGESKVVATFGPKAVLGEIAIVYSENRIASLRAVEDADLVYFSGIEFNGLIKSQNKDAYIIGYNIAVMLAERLNMANNLIYELASSKGIQERKSEIAMYRQQLLNEGLI